MKLAVSADTVKSALSAHAAIGLIGGALLYLLCLSGTVLVLYEEWQRFEQQDAPEMQSISPAAVQRGIVQVIETEADRTPTTHLYVHMPTEELPRTTVTTDHQAFHLTSDGAVAVPEENAWSEFLYALHYAFNLPVLVGITIVGALGALMVTLAITGVIALPRIFRDAFRLRAKQSGGIALADWHNRLSVWTLPFTLAIAITGAVIGLATIAAYAMAQGEYGGDVEAVYAPLFGGEDPADLTPAPLPDVAAAMDHMAAEHPGVEVTYAILHDPGTAGQHVQMVGAHGQRLIFGEYYHFRPDGTFVGGSVTDQAEQVMSNLEAVLAAAGCTFADVVKATCYLTDMNDFKEFNAVYGSRFGDQPPARTTVAVAALPVGAKVEVELVALLK